MEEGRFSSEAKYRELVENANSIILRLDTRGNITFFNEFAQTFFGYADAEILGKSVLGTIVPETDRYGRDITATLQDLIQHPEQYRYHENENICRNGERVWISWTNKAILDAEGHLVGLLWIGNDITRRKLAEEALQSANEELERRVQERTAALVEANEQLRREIADRFLAESRLRRQNSVLLELAKSQTLNGGDLKAAVKEITEAAARTLEVERVSVWLFKEDSSELHCLNLYELEANCHTASAKLDAVNYPSYFRALVQARTIAAHDAQTDPRTRELSEPYMRSLGIASMLDAPVRLGGKLVGVVCHEHIGSPRRWALEEENFAGSIADLISLAIEACVSEILLKEARKEAESALARSEQWYRALIQNATDMVKVIDEEGIYRYASPSSEAITGYAPEELAGTSSWSMIHPEDLPKARAAFQEGLKNPGVPVRVTLRSRHKDGRWLYEEVTGRNLLSDPVVRGIVINSRDITERQQAEEALASSEAWFKALIQGSTDMIDVLDREGNYIYASPSTEKITGMKPTALIGKPCWDFVHPEDVSAAREIFVKILENPGKPMQVTLRVLHKQRQSIYLEVLGRNLLEHPAVGGIVLNSRDVSDRMRSSEVEMRLSASVQEAKDQLQAVLDAIPGYVSWMSSDLKYIGVNRYLASSFGLSPEEFASQEVGFMKSAGEFAEFASQFFASPEREASREIETFVKGQSRYQLIAAQKYNQGKMAAFVGIDITERKRMEEDLRISEEKFAKAFRSSPDSLTISTLQDGKYIEVNDGFVRILGYDRAEAIGRSVGELNIWVDREERDRLKEILKERGGVDNQEFEFRKKSGEILVGLLSAEIITLRGVPCMLAVARDITERKRSEEALSRSEAKNRALLNAIPDLMFRISREGTYLEVRAGKDSELLVPADRQIGKSIYEILPKEVADERMQYIQQALSTGETQIWEYELWIASVLRHYEARIVVSGCDEVLAIVRDITERKLAEKQLRAAAERDRILREIDQRIGRSLDLDEILHTTCSEVRHFLQADRVLIANMEPHKRGEVVAESVAPNLPSCLGLATQDDDYLNELRALFDRSRVYINEDTTKIQISPARAQFLRKFQVKASLGVPIIMGDHLLGLLVAHQCTGARRWQPFEIDLLQQLAPQVAIAIQKAQLYQQKANLTAILERQVRDRTAELHQKMQELQELNKLKDVFLHAVSHDLRTPVMGTLMVLKNLLNKGLGTGQFSQSPISVPRTVLERMIQSGDRQLSLINSLLEVHSSEVQGIALHAEPTQLSQLIKSIVADVEPLLEKNQATLTNLVSDDLPWVNVDSTQLWRVYENLITNALKHNPPGVHLTIGAVLEEQMIRCAIADNGVGMTLEQCDRLFDLYYRGANARHLTGIGLGLYLCRQIIAAHGGNIGVISSPGAGATFWFTLPLATR